MVKKSLKINLTEKLFSKLEGLAEVGKFFINPPRTRAELYCPDLYRIRREAEFRWGKKVIRNILKNFSRVGYLRCDKEQKKYFLTAKGMSKILENIIQRKVRNKIKMKNKYLVLIFDIPEKERSKRNFLRRKLYEKGFKMIQRSVWISRCDIIKELAQYIYLNNLDRYIRLFIAEEAKI